jgi:hypothetical protein
VLPCAGAVRGEENRDLEIPFHGSGDIVAASRADDMFEISFSVRKLPTGERIRLYPAWGELLILED